MKATRGLPPHCVPMACRLPRHSADIVTVGTPGRHARWRASHRCPSREIDRRSHQGRVPHQGKGQEGRSGSAGRTALCVRTTDTAITQGHPRPRAGTRHARSDQGSLAAVGGGLAGRFGAWDIPRGQRVGGSPDRSHARRRHRRRRGTQTSNRQALANAGHRRGYPCCRGVLGVAGGALFHLSGPLPDASRFTQGSLAQGAGISLRLACRENAARPTHAEELISKSWRSDYCIGNRRG